MTSSVADLLEVRSEESLVCMARPRRQPVELAWCERRDLAEDIEASTFW